MLVIAAACAAPNPSIKPSATSSQSTPRASLQTAAPLGSSWVKLPVQPRGGPGDLKVQGAYAGPNGIALTGQLGGPLAEQASRARAVAWYSADGTNWLPAAVDDVSNGQPFDLRSTFGPIFAVDHRLMAFTTRFGSEAPGLATSQPLSLSLAYSVSFLRRWLLIAATTLTFGVSVLARASTRPPSYRFPTR